jgi:hypothetical protein
VNRALGVLLVAIVALALLQSAGPAISGAFHSAIPLVLAIGFVVIVVRTVWWLTGRW